MICAPVVSQLFQPQYSCKFRIYLENQQVSMNTHSKKDTSVLGIFPNTNLSADNTPITPDLETWVDDIHGVR